MDCPTTTGVVDLEEGGILERVGCADRDVELIDVVEHMGERRAELVESLDRELIRPGRCSTDKSDLLDHDVEEVVGVQPNFARPVKRGTEPIQLGLELAGRNPDQAAGEATIMGAPHLIVMPAVGQRRIAGERLPESAIGAVPTTSAAPFPPPIEPVHWRARLFDTEDLDWRQAARRSDLRGLASSLADQGLADR